jgi:hypothetical protein
MSIKLLNFMEKAPKSMGVKSQKALWWLTERTGRTLNNKHSTTLIRRRIVSNITATRLRSTNNFKAVFSEVVTSKEHLLNLIVTQPKLALEALLIGKHKVVWPNLLMLDHLGVQTRTYRSRSSCPQAFWNRLTTTSTFRWRRSKKIWTISVMFTNPRLRD